MLLKNFENHDAAVNKFVAIDFTDDSQWSIQVDASAVVGGTPNYTILGSNISMLEADMKPYRSASSNVPLTEGVDSESFRYRFFGLKYLANGATGVVKIYFERKLDK